MDVGLITVIAIIAVILIIILIVITAIRNKIRSVSRSLFGTDSLIDGYKQQTHEYNETPRSLHSMTKVYLPLILHDFPEFEYEAYRNKVESLLRSYFTAVSTKKASVLTEECSLTLKNNVQGIIDDLNSKNQKRIFSSVTLHDIQIAKYVKNGATATVFFEASVGCYSYIEDEKGNVVSGSREEKNQSVYQIGLVYVQDIDKIGSHLEGLGINCPNCGAPLTSLGAKKCEYCGSPVLELNIHAWTFTKVTPS